MIMMIENKTDNVQYFDKAAQEILQDHIDNPLGIITEESASAHFNNANFYIYRPDTYNEVLKNIVPVPPRSAWEYADGKFVCIEKENIYKNNTWDKGKFLDAVHWLLQKIKGKNIAVHLSGGLDSSIIIGVLNTFEIYPLLIGMRNNRYEFRTERIIQDKIAQKNKQVIYLDDEKNLPFSMVLDAPKHVIPCTTSLFCPAQIAIAKVCQENSIDILFNGMGLDAVFCFEPDEENRQYWLPWMYENAWFGDNIYAPRGISFWSGIYSRILSNAFWNLRKGEGEDNKKNWARRFFKDFIPAELVNYRYKADHGGLYIDGITESLGQIKYLFERIYQLTKYQGFSLDNFKRLFSDYHITDDTKLKEILAYVSFAGWLYAWLPK
jgi:hypothetical protein